jgi:hypothetical protein
MTTYTCWSSHPEDTWKIEAYNARDAAQKYAKRIFDVNYNVRYVESLEIHVSDGAEMRTFTVEIDMEPVFFASPVEKQEMT